MLERNLRDRSVGLLNVLSSGVLTKAFAIASGRKSTPNLFRQYIYLILPCEHLRLSAFCIRAYMHAWLTWDTGKDLTHGKSGSKHVLWVLQFGHLPYIMGSGVSGVHMLQYWHFGHVSHFSCAPRAEVLKIVFLCFGIEAKLIKGLEALGCFHAKG